MLRISLTKPDFSAASLCRDADACSYPRAYQSSLDNDLARDSARPEERGDGIYPGARRLARPGHETLVSAPLLQRTAPEPRVLAPFAVVGETPGQLLMRTSAGAV